MSLSVSPNPPRRPGAAALVAGLVGLGALSACTGSDRPGITATNDWTPLPGQSQPVPTAPQPRSGTQVANADAPPSFGQRLRRLFGGDPQPGTDAEAPAGTPPERTPPGPTDTGAEEVATEDESEPTVIDRVKRLFAWRSDDGDGDAAATGSDAPTTAASGASRSGAPGTAVAASAETGTGATDVAAADPAHRIADRGALRAAAGPLDTAANCTGPAIYNVNFDAIWAPATHPDDFPGDAQFSRPVAVAHADGAGFWSYGEDASLGLEVMAETGDVEALRREIMTMTAAGLAGEPVIGRSFRAPGMTALRVEATPQFSYLSVTATIAPSPDWFVGVAAVPLCGDDGWIDVATVDLFALDAGTDDGTTYTADDVEADPRQPIRLLSESGVRPAALYGRNAFGMLTLERVDPATVPGVAESPATENAAVD